MGVLTLADFETEILAGLGGRTENTAITSTRMVAVLNLAQARISRSYDFSEMADVAFAQLNFTGNTATDKYMSTPPNVKTIHSLVLLDTSSGLSSMGQSRKLIEKPWRWFDQHFPAPEWLPPGWPEIYARWGTRFVVFNRAPFLQFSAQMRFIRYATPFVLANTTQSSDFEAKDDIIINYTLGYFFKSLGRADRAQYFEGLAKEQLDEAIERDDTRPDIEISRDTDGLASVVSTPYWADPWVRNSP